MKGLPKTNRRTLKDIKRFQSPREISETIKFSKSWPYKSDMTFYFKRDRALLSLLYLTGARINEVLRVEHAQFDFFSKPNFVVIKDFQISKRKKETIARVGVPKIDIPLPLKGQQAVLTEYVQDYLTVAPKEGPIFKFGRTRAYQIVNNATGLWCHYFRSQKLSYLVNLFKSALITAKLTGIRNTETISHYYKTEWERHEKEFLK